MPTDPLAVVAAEIVKQDAALQSRIRGIVELALDEAERILHYGTGQVKVGLIRTLVPAVVKEMRQKEEESDAIKEMRASLAEIAKEMRTTVGGGQYVADDDSHAAAPIDEG